MDLLTVWTAEAWGGGGDAVGEQGWRREERDGEGGREGGRDEQDPLIQDCGGP